MIHELLSTGRDNARTGRELARFLRCTLRDVTAQVERERRDGQPICAATGNNPGYFLPANPEELERYCNALKRRCNEIDATLQAMVCGEAAVKQRRKGRNDDGRGCG